MEFSQPRQEEATPKFIKSVSSSRRWVAITLVIVCVLISWVGTIDDKTEEYVDGAIIQAVAAYAGARTLNAGISLLQSGEIGGGFLIADVSIHPFETLDPLNDMVEDYATVMKFSIGSLMIQKLLVEILSASIFKWLITGAAVLLLASLLIFNGVYATFLLKSFFFIALIRFLFVITILVCGLVDSTFVNEKTETELNKVKIATTEVAQFEGGNSETNSAEREGISRQIRGLETQRDDLADLIKIQGNVVTLATSQRDKARKTAKEIWEKMGLERWNPLHKNEDYENAKQATEDAEKKLKEQNKILKDLESQLETVQESLAAQHNQLYGEKGVFEKAKSQISKLKELSFGRIKSAITDSIESMLQLIAIFVFKTLLMPLGFLFLILRAFKLIWGIDPRSLVKGEYSEIKGG